MYWVQYSQWRTIWWKKCFINPFQCLYLSKICETHGILKYGPIVCRICEENDDVKNGIIKRPTHKNNIQVTKISCSIGNFHSVHY